jgi:aryl sulfotransferase
MEGQMPELLRPAVREVHGPVTDSTRWSAYKPRPDDIVVATYPKCGTTWTQRIVDLLVFGNGEPRQFLSISPWLDSLIFGPLEMQIATLEAQTHRRFIKSHVTFDALPIYEGVKYIHVARDGRDAAFSMHNHQLGFKREFVDAMRGPDGKGGPPPTPEDPRAYFLFWLQQAEAGGMPGDPDYFTFENTYWERRADPNLLMVHYADMKADLVGEMARIAEFLEIKMSRDQLAGLAVHAEFERMKKDGDLTMPQLHMAFDGGPARFINKGTNGRWRDVLTDDDLARYARLAQTRFSPAAARWIENGRLAAGDPRTL